VTNYVREGYNQAVREKKSYVGFLMLLMQRLVSSSTRAIRVTLERRLEALRAPEEQLTLFPVLSEEEWTEMDGQEQLDALLSARVNALRNERAEVELLLEAARHTEAAGADAKAEALLELIYRLQREEGDPTLKLLIFTEFVPTQEMLREFLERRGFAVACLNGSMDLEERQRAQEAFAGGAQILVSTDAGGEGLNLQFCHVVVNYDIPWNPMRLEQRIGRVDRIGQVHPVRAINLLLRHSVEYRVREVLEEKLAVILREFGVDKVSDVLDSAQSGQLFEQLQVDALLHPDNLDSSVDSVSYQLQEQARAIRETASIFSTEGDLDPNEARRLMDHPVSYWIERMVVSYLEANGGKAERAGKAWRLVWPGGDEVKQAVFAPCDLEAVPTARQLTLDDARVRRLVDAVPEFVKGQPIPRITFPEMAPGVCGCWSLWRVEIVGADAERGQSEGGETPLARQFMPVFLHDDGRLLLPTARHIWDQLVAGVGEVSGEIAGDQAAELFRALRDAAEAQGKPLYDGLLSRHREGLAKEREKGEHAFAARRRAVGRIGLAAVRGHRLAQLDREEREWRQRLVERAEVMPGLVPLLMVRVGGD
ncbi:MAG: helicase-related protein, partial [Chloroflexota bacterium]